MIADIQQPHISETSKRRAEKRKAKRASFWKLQEKVLKIPSLIIVDLFCGAGGTTTGFMYSGVGEVIACVNHDHNAIISHWANHPRVRHFTEDMRTLNLDKLVEIVQKFRAKYPKAKLVLWASLECTNFSKAKGGMARDADSRTLADYLHRYITAMDPDYIMIENVVEFREWGPIRIKAKETHLHRDDEKGIYPYTELTMIKQKRVEEYTVKVKGKGGQIKEKIKKRFYKVDTYGWVPIQELKGVDFKRWCGEVMAHGYNMEWKEMNSADWGAFTSRNRLFGMFAKPGLNIVWPAKTHSKNGVSEEEQKKLGKKGVHKLLKWNAVKHCIDFSDEGYSILHRSINMDIPERQREDLVENTLERVYMGCIKHIAGGKKKFAERLKSVNEVIYQTESGSFIKKYYSGRPESRTTSIDDPLSVIPTENRHSIVNCSFLSKYFSGVPYNKNISTEGPAGAIKTVDGQAIVNPHFITQRNSGNSEYRSVDIEGPARTLTATGGNQDVVSANFLSCYYGNGDNTHNIENPCPTLGCKDTASLVNLNFIDKAYSGNANHSSIEDPAGALMSKDKFSVVSVQPGFIARQYSGGGQDSSLNEPIGSLPTVPKANLIQIHKHFIDNTNYSNSPKSVEDPMGVITADRHWPYLVNPSWGGNPHSVEEPCPVIVASQHKAPLSVVFTETGDAFIEIYETDSFYTRKIKEFMALYGIVDIKMRMLKVSELKIIQGFPPKYTLAGSQADQKKFIGNSVVPHVVKFWALEIHEDLEDYYSKAA